MLTKELFKDQYDTAYLLIIIERILKYYIQMKKK